MNINFLCQQNIIFCLGHQVLKKIGTINSKELRRFNDIINYGLLIKNKN